MKSIRLAFARGSKQAVFSEIGGNIAEIHISFLHSQSEMSRNNPARCGWLEPPSSPPVPDVDTVPTPVDYQQLTNDWFRYCRSECFRCVAVVRFEPYFTKRCNVTEGTRTAKSGLSARNFSVGAFRPHRGVWPLICINDPKLRVCQSLVLCGLTTNVTACPMSLNMVRTAAPSSRDGRCGFCFSGFC